MERLNELCDIIEQNPKQFLDKLPWICQQCPQSKLLRAESPRFSQSHLNAILAVTRILSKIVDTTDENAKFVVLDFLQTVPKSFHRSFWPYSLSLESISAFYCSFLGYVSCLSQLYVLIFNSCENSYIQGLDVVWCVTWLVLYFYWLYEIQKVCSYFECTY